MSGCHCCLFVPCVTTFRGPPCHSLVLGACKLVVHFWEGSTFQENSLIRYQIEVQFNNIDEFAQQAVLFLRQPTFLQVVMLKNTSPHPMHSKQLPQACYRLSVKDKKGSLDLHPRPSRSLFSEQFLLLLLALCPLAWVWKMKCLAVMWAESKRKMTKCKMTKKNQEMHIVRV